MKARFDDQDLDNWRLQQDEMSDRVIEAYFPGQKGQLQGLLASLTDNASHFTQKADPKLKELWTEIQEISETLDYKVINNGQAFFNKHASDIMLLLGMLSLPYCYAAANGAEVLVRSERILNDPEKRLSETAQFVFEVMAKDAFSAQGQGMVSILKVRLMHAAVRWYINQSDNWNEIEYGKPVNQEDMAGTNLSFSLMVVRGLRRLGKMIRPTEAEAYIQYWNVVGRMLGLRTDALPANNKASFLLEKRIRLRQFRPSEAGQKLGASLFEYFESVARDSHLEGKVIPFANFLLGEEISEMIGIQINETQSVLFKPYTLFLKISNQVLSREDSYAKAYLNYKQQSAGLAKSDAYQLPT